MTEAASFLAAASGESLATARTKNCVTACFVNLTDL